MKVFLDTNVLASALATRGLCAELFEVVVQSHKLQTSKPVLDELRRVLPGKLGLSETLTTDFTTLILAHADLVEAGSQSPTLPDPDDVPIIASALSGKADVFVTGDKALIELGIVEQLPIMSPRQFWELLSTRDKPFQHRDIDKG